MRGYRYSLSVRTTALPGWTTFLVNRLKISLGQLQSRRQDLAIRRRLLEWDFGESAVWYLTHSPGRAQSSIHEFREGRFGHYFSIIVVRCLAILMHS
jgi:hypothetical protein